MMNDDYQPIACGLHSQLELWAMHQEEVMLKSAETEVEGRVKDVVARNGAEYLVLLVGSTEQNFRLDKIDSIGSIKDQTTWPT